MGDAMKKPYAQPEQELEPLAVEGSPPATGSHNKPARRKACNQCKQQKLRCNLASVEAENATECARCLRLGLQCKIESGFRRTRKRRRSFELQNEIKALRRQLQLRNEKSPASPRQPRTRSQTTQPSHPDSGLLDSMVEPRAYPTVGPSNSTPTPIAASSPNLAEHHRAPGLTTEPNVDYHPVNQSASVPIPYPRALGNTALSVEMIDELFIIYIVDYHPFLPLIDPGKSPHEYYENSQLLFWSIVAVASRHFPSHPTLLPKLARSVTDLLWKTLRSVPYDLATVQALLLLCTWPFPTNSSTADPTFMLSGVMLQLATQMGLHRVLDAQDFVKTPLRLTGHEHSEWEKTWQACNIVAQSVSVGSGLPVMMQMQDWSSPAGPTIDSSTPPDNVMRARMQIEQFRHRVSQTLAPSSVMSPNPVTSGDKPHHYERLEAMLLELEGDVGEKHPITTWHLIAAKLHLQAFHLTDDTDSPGYDDGILHLYETAAELIGQSQELDRQGNGFFAYCPFFCYQVFVTAAFVILKISFNRYFETIVDADMAEKLLNTAIVALRKTSVVNNDLPARLGDVIGFFCTLSDRTVIGGSTRENLKLTQVKNRLSMSIVYDSLWTWRKHFQIEKHVGDSRASQGISGGTRSCSETQDMQNMFQFDPMAELPGFFDLELPTYL